MNARQRKKQRKKSEQAIVAFEAIAGAGRKAEEVLARLKNTIARDTSRFNLNR